MKLSNGQRIYYTGDMANIEDYGTVTNIRPPNRFYGESYDITLDDGREQRDIQQVSFDPGPGRRFWPAMEWDQHRAQQLKESQASMRRVLNQ